jgi:hypothetical protein
MDLRERVAKVEAVVETLKHDIDRLYSAIERLREHTDKGFAELRASQDNNTKWLLRILLAIVAMIAAMAGRLFGLF